MADRFTYGAGVSAQPIDVVSGGQRLLEAAVEQKKRDIDQKRAVVTDSAKALVDAMSRKTIKGLDRVTQSRYQQKLDEQRSKMVEAYSKGGGKIDKPIQLQFQQDFDDIEGQMTADFEAIKQRDNVRQLLLHPDAQYAYNIEGAFSELSKWDKAFEKGEYLGDPMTIAFKHQIPASVDDYISKRYKNAIDKLDIESLGGFKGNVFTKTDLAGLNVKQADSIQKVQRLVEVAMDDPNVKSQYVARDGTVFEEEEQRVRKSIEDAISQRISESRPYKQATGSGRTFAPYVVEDRLEESVPIDKENEVVTAYEKSVPLNNITSFIHDKKKMAVESVGYMPVAKDKEKYKKWVQAAYDKKLTGEDLMYTPEKQSISKHGIVSKDHLGQYNGEIEYKPFAKVGTTKSKRQFSTWEDIWSMADPNTENDVNVDFLPFEGALKGAILAKTLTKKDAYEKTFSELDALMRKSGVQGRSGFVNLPQSGKF